MNHRKRTFTIAITGLLILGGAYFGVRYAEAKPYLDRQSSLDQNIAKAKELGIPLTAQDLRNRWPVKPEENAGPVLLKTIKDLNALPKDVRLSPADFQAMLENGSSKLPELRKRLSSIQSELDLAVAASKLPKLDFERNWDLGYKLDFKELGDTKQLIRYLGVRAQLSARSGDLQASLSDLRACYRICTLLGQDPTVMGLTTQLTSLAMVDVAVQKALPSISKDKNSLLALREIVRKERKVDDWSRAFYGEAYLGVASIRVVKDWTDYAYMYSGDVGPTNPFRQIPKWLAMDTVKNAFMSEYLRAVNEAYAAGGSPLQINEAIREVEILSFKRTNSKHPTTAVLSILLPTFPLSDDTFLKTKGVGLCLNTLLDVYVYRSEKGHFPATLGEAGISDVDPYDHGKLVYRPMPSRVMVYSYGKNGVDDGAAGRTGETGGSKDLVVWAAL